MDKLAIVLISILGGILLCFLLCFPTMWGWNAVMPRLFHLPSIGLADAFWLDILASTFFKSSHSCCKKS